MMVMQVHVHGLAAEGGLGMWGIMELVLEKGFGQKLRVIN